MEPKVRNPLGRRDMIRAMGWLALVPLAGLWAIMVRREMVHKAGRTFKILLADIPEGGSYFRDFWVIRDQARIEVFSTRCPHLGCKVQPAPGGRLLCPCHGSAFDQLDGSLIRGPAGKSLRRLDYTIEDDLLTIYTKTD